MAKNLAKRFATMTLLYWDPEYTASGVKYTDPVEFKGFYVTNANIFGGGVSQMISANDDRLNMVLFYKLEPKPNGCVSWKMTLKDLEDNNLVGLPPTEIKDTYVIKRVSEIPMLRTKKRDINNLAFIAVVE